MGLDMYLTGEIYIPTDWENPENNLYEDGYRVKGRYLDLGYWRKHPDLHGFIVKTFAEGVDECQRIELSVRAMQQIIAAIEDDQLPKTSGFFFGESENDDDQKKEAIEIFTKAINWLDADQSQVWRSVIYQASW